ncbi:flagellar basal body rod protein FlgC [Thioalkalivibrio sp. XN279]|uniref:flagellar basal body rod protein FlgC n=1 Tax=Thioalkalivibrio sp. XN279 TaxID=2714953 RepID=UPI0014095228|nr:flagellar basal body rod protein FlgC [Thioalkalivibrio sp. XN279]NHA13386.1 flagellar basal body rod protein FlgC [Thioalkalivibrio sp. XN279]
MNLGKIFHISGSALSAQSTRLNTIASNLANADTAASTPEAVYRARHPVFAATLEQATAGAGPQAQSAPGVRVTGIVESQAPPVARHDPGNPLADENGYVYLPAINTVEQMADMISASRSYSSSVEVLSTTRDLMLRTLQLGRG